jgi:large subunit ribosomal protein L20
MEALKKANIEVNRKMLAEMAVNDPTSFSKLLELVSNTNDN